MKQLRRYWFTFEKSSNPTPLNLGCGVTAFDYEDALSLLRERVFIKEPLPTIIHHIGDIDVSTLEKNHVFPNMGLVTDRGIWFPLGYN